LCGWLLLLLGGCGPQPPPEPILIGHLVPLQGAEQAAGRHARQGSQLAVARARAEDLGVNGRSFTVVYGDTSSDPEQARNETVRLLAVNRVVAIITGPTATSSSAVVREARPYRAPVVVPGVAIPSVEEAAVVQLGVGPAARGRALARHTAGPLKARKAEVLTNGDPSSTALKDGFEREWASGNRRLESLTYTSADRAEKAAKVAQDGPDVVVVAGPMEDCFFFRDALKKAGSRTRLCYGGEDHGPEAFTATLAPGPDVYLATVFSGDKLAPRGAEIARRYQQDFNELMDLTAAEAYDAAWLLFTTIHRAQSTAADRLREELGALESFESLTGPVTFKDRQVQRPVFVVRVTDGKAHVEEMVGP
jgi:ABC-type branched-subunit amino acid transport system substrate-binding protein